MKPCLRLAAALGITLTACNTTTASTAFQPYTAVYVEPADFRGGVACSDATGAMQSYVATLIDVTDGDPSCFVTVASSPPTSCQFRASFSQVVPGHFYVTEIDAYEQPACPFGQQAAGCLVPAGGWGSGSRIMLLASGPDVPPPTAIASPRWTTHCGSLSTGSAGSAGAAGQGGSAGQAGAGGAGAGGAGASGASGEGGQSGASGQSGSGAGGEAGQSAGGSAGDAGQGGSAGGDAGQSGAGGSAGSGQGGGVCDGSAGSRPTEFDDFNPLGPTEAVYQTAARASGCGPLPAATGPASVRITTAAMQDGLGCGKSDATAHRVKSFELRRDKTVTPVECGADALFENLAPGQTYQWSLLAFESGASGPTWGSRCSARASAGLQVNASCEPLSTRGSLLLDAAPFCQNASSYRVTVVGLDVPAFTRLCPADLAVHDLPQGQVDLLVDLRDAQGQSLGSALCSGRVLPGQQVAADCSL